MTMTGKPDLARLLSAIAGRRHDPAQTDALALAAALSGGRHLTVMLPQAGAAETAEDIHLLDEPAPPHPGAGLLAAIPGISLAADPDEADIALALHLPGMAAADTAAAIQAAVSVGHRVALADVSGEGQQGDPALLPALANTALYISNLAAYDTDIARVVAAVNTPIRDGQAHRRYLAYTILYYWAWRGIVKREVRASFGEVIPERWLPRAITQARSRLGATMMKVRGRGLRFDMHALGFDAGRVDGFWVSLEGDR